MSDPEMSGPGAVDPERISAGIPARIGDYRIDERLGAGGMGEVYRAFDDHLERAVAIKLIRADQSGSTSAQERFRREAQAIARLDHPAIVRIHHIQKWRDHHCIVMELVEGQTLAELVEAGPCDPRRAAVLMRQIAEGLAEAHAQGIVHRDLKTINVMVTPAGNAKILDFGLAKRLMGKEESVSVPGTIVGTLHTMSPEQASGQPVDFRADLFSLGVLAYELLTGTSPFRAETSQETITRVISHRPPPVRELKPRVPPELSDLVDHLLEKDAARRPASALEVTAALARWADTAASMKTGSPQSTLRVARHVESQRPTIASRPQRPGDDGAGEAAAEVETIAQRAAPQSAAAANRPRRTLPWREAAVAAAIAVVLLLALIAFPSRQIDEPPSASTTSTLAILGFAAADPAPEKAWISAALVETLADELRAHPRIQVLQDEWTAQIRDAASSRDDLDDLIDVAVNGVVEVSGGELSLHLNLSQLATGAESSLSISGIIQDLPMLAHDAAVEVEARLGMDLFSGEIQPFTNTLPRAPAAFHLYAEGLADGRTGDFIAARDHFDAALAIEAENSRLHLARGLVLLELGDTTEAESAARTALVHAAELPKAARLEIEATSHHLLGDWPAAFAAYDDLYSEHPDELVYGIRRAEMQTFLDETRDALRSLEELRASARGFFVGLVDLAEAGTRLAVDDVDRAKQLALRAAQMGQRLRIPSFEASARLIEGMARERSGEREEALAALDRAWNLFDQTGSLQSMLDVLIEKAIVLAREGDSEGARRLLETARRTFAEHDDEWAEALVGATLGNVLDELGEYGEAEKTLERSLEIFETHEDRQSAAQTLLNLGAVYQNTGRLGEARTVYERALLVFRELDDRDNAAYTLNNLGELFYWNGDLGHAESSYRETLEIIRELGDTDGEAYGLLRLGEIVLLRSSPEDLSLAREHFVASLELAQELEDEVAMAGARLALARLEIDADNSSAAESEAKKAEAAYLEAGMDDEVALSRAERARAFLRRRRPEVERARRLEQKVRLQAAQSGDHRVRFEAAVLAARLDALESGDLREARQQLEQLATDAESAGWVLDAWKTHLLLGEIEIDWGETAAGRARLEAVGAESEAQGWTLFARRAASASRVQG